MKRRDFLDILKEKGNFNSKIEAEEALDSVIESIKLVLRNKDKITFSGLGTFYTADVKEKTGTIPKTDKTYVKPAHKTPRFRVSKTLKTEIE
jgi:DNA-binding protein HU-beta